MNLVLCHNLRQRGPYMNNSLRKVLKTKVMMGVMIWIICTIIYDYSAAEKVLYWSLFWLVHVYTKTLLVYLIIIINVYKI